MAYGTFKTYEEVAEKFKIKLSEISFIQEKKIPVKEEMYNYIMDNLMLRRNYISEISICETMISPILTVVSKYNDLPLWSHIRFDISEEDGLVGIPDYIADPVSDVGTTLVKPVLCVAEAKKDNFNEGWAQLLAELIAVKRFNNDDTMEIFGIVTSGEIWKFGKLKEKLLTMEVVPFSALENLKKLFNIVNWLFSEAKKNPGIIQDEQRKNT